MIMMMWRMRRMMKQKNNLNIFTYIIIFRQGKRPPPEKGKGKKKGKDGNEADDESEEGMIKNN